MTEKACPLSELTLPVLSAGGSLVSNCPSDPLSSVPSQQLCNFSAVGYDCQSTQCVRGNWSLKTPVCSPLGCDVLAHSYPFPQNEGGVKSSVTDCVNNSLVAHGHHCSNYLPGHACPSTVCDRGGCYRHQHSVRNSRVVTPMKTLHFCCKCQTGVVVTCVTQMLAVLKVLSCTTSPRP